MKGLIYDIKRFALHDGPGIRTTVFFKGCPLDCWWCHNPESQNPCIETSTKTDFIEGKRLESVEETGYYISPDDLLREIQKDRAFMDESGGGVTFSGGEPFMQPAFLDEILKLCRQEGIHIALDTSGFVNHSLFRNTADSIDLFLFDIKHIDEDQHRKYTSVSNRLIFKNLDFLHISGKEVIIRFPLVPGINDGEHIPGLIDFLTRKYPDFRQVHILPYHNIASHKYERFLLQDRMKGTLVPEAGEVKKVAGLFRESGFEIKIGG